MKHCNSMFHLMFQCFIFMFHLALKTYIKEKPKTLWEKNQNIVQERANLGARDFKPWCKRYD